MRDRDEIILPDGRRVPLQREREPGSEMVPVWTDELPTFRPKANRDRRRRRRSDGRPRLFDIVT
ncbi:MAG: hypothetical protein ACOCYE_10075 [Pseudomonadota bacterium]